MDVEKLSCQSSSLAPVAEAVPSSSVMEDCLKLLRGETVQSSALTEGCLKLLREEPEFRRLAVLLLVAKVCQDKDDYYCIIKVYLTLGLQFFLRLLRTGRKAGRGDGACLELSVTELAAFCKVPKIAASSRLLHVIPLLMQILYTGGSVSPSGTIEDCYYELLYLVANAQEDGVRVLYESGGIGILASQMPDLLLVGSNNVVQYAVELVQLMLTKFPANETFIKHPSELAMLVVEASRIFGLLRTDDVKFKVSTLRFISLILCSQRSAPVKEALRSLQKVSRSTVWLTNILSGVVAILNSAVTPDDKLQALFLAESTISVVGIQWLIGQVDVTKGPFLSDWCILLENCRVEIVCLLNDFAYLRFEASKSTCASSVVMEAMTSMCKDLSMLLYLVRAVMELISNKSGDGGAHEDLHDPDAAPTSSDYCILTKITSALEETILFVLNYLGDAKEHGQNRGDDLLASVELIAKYLELASDGYLLEILDEASVPLNYMLSVLGNDEVCPVMSTGALLPLINVIVMGNHAIRDVFVVTSGALEGLVKSLLSFIVPTSMVEDVSLMFCYNCCCILLIFLEYCPKLRSAEVDVSLFILLGPVSRWAVKTNNMAIILMASSLCALILASQFEKDVLCYLELNPDLLNPLSQVISRSVAVYARASDVPEEDDHPYLAKGCYQLAFSHFKYCGSSWVERLPSLKEAIERQTEGSEAWQLKDKLD
ncbi:OLC1v1026990C1 [Oldenlandia corymbosa var. corymbosa]|nr:OLC1v1026990C1 [Oldenlandia corymbosa var. corymbosa]